MLEIIILIVIPILLCVIASKKAEKKVRKESMTINDFNKEKTYFRDIIDNYSPSEISYIDDFDVDLEKDIIATLLKLELKNVIKINENNIEIINENIILNRSETLILNKIKNNKLNQIDAFELKDEAISDCLRNELIVKNPVKVKAKKEMKPIFSEYTFIKSFIFWIVIFIPLCFFNSQVVDFLNNVVVPNINIILPIILILIFIIILIKYIKLYTFTYDAAYVQEKNNSFIRTKKGEEVNKKIEGLRNFLNDFGNIDSKEKSELIVWEDYLIYACLFGINNDIINDLKKFIK